MNNISFLFLCSALAAGTFFSLGENSSPTAPTAPMDADSTRLLEESSKEDKVVDEDVAQFMRDHGVSMEDAGKKDSPAPASDPKSSTPSGAPEIAGKPADTVVTCDGGMYFDSEKGIVVYLKNVRVRDPQFSLDCDKELRVFLRPDEKKAAKKKNDDSGDDKEPKFGSNMNVNFNGAKKLTASGNVIVKGQDKKGKKYEGRAQNIIYDVQTEEMLMTGGYPSIKDEKNDIRCIDPGGYIRMTSDGKLIFHGRMKSNFKDIQKESDFGKTKKKP